jgi:hypothetical protein
MQSVPGQSEARRQFLRMLVTSPLFAGSHFFGNILTNLLATNVSRRIGDEFRPSQ